MKKMLKRVHHDAGKEDKKLRRREGKLRKMLKITKEYFKKTLCRCVSDGMCFCKYSLFILDIFKKNLYKIPLVEGISLFPSIFEHAVFNALAKDLKIASIIWCVSLPSRSFTCIVDSVFCAKLLKKCGRRIVSKSEVFSSSITASTFENALPERSTTDNAKASSIGKIKFP